MSSSHQFLGPDPRGALQFIDRLRLYPTIFADHKDGSSVDTSTWSLAYNFLEKLLHTQSGESEDVKAAVERIRRTLIRDSNEAFSAWIVATFAPWSTVPARETKNAKAKQPSARAAEVARDSLRSDNKTINLLNDAVGSFRNIIDVKSSLLENNIGGTSAEIRQKIGLHIRSWKKDWRLCVLLAMFYEIMNGRDSLQGKSCSFASLGQAANTPLLAVIQTYDAFLSYITKNGLEGACEMRTIVSGGEIIRALGAKPGPWMGEAMDQVIKWQLLHPEITEKKKALQEVIEKKAELGLGSE